MNFEDEEEWDLELLDKLVQTEEQAIAARRSASQPPPRPLPPSPLSLSLRKVPPHSLPTQDDAPSLVLDLRQRLLQAEQELSGLRQKVLQPTVVATSTLEQELRRLQSEILFKDQEILEARRACTEKSEQLKRALAETEELRKGPEDVKRVKWQTNVSARTKHKTEERRENAATISKTSLADINGSEGPPNQELWCPPWTLSGQTSSLQGTSKSKSSSPQAVQSQCTFLDREEPAPIKELKSRVLENGCTSSCEKETKICSSQLQQLEIATISINGNSIQDENKTKRQGVIDKQNWEHLFLSNVLNIWCPRNMKEEGKGLLSKVLALCETDVRILVSVDSREVGYGQHLKKNRALGKMPSTISKRAISDSFGDGIDGGSASSGTHSLLSVITKVASGLISTWKLFTAVLELCEVDNIQVSESALRVLHCILIHDEGCQNKIFGRNRFTPQSQQEFQKSADANCSCKGTVESNASLRAFECLISADSPACVLRSYLSSPRISWQNESFPYSQTNVQGMPFEKIRGLEMNDRKSQQKDSECIASVECNQGAWSARIFKRTLFKAVSGSSEAIKIAAISILVALVMNAEPMHERERFGFILFDGSVASLLRISAGLEMRLQAVQLTHGLLHCPPVLKKLLDIQDQALAPPTSKELGLESGPLLELEVDARNSEENVVLQNDNEMSVQFETAGNMVEKCSLNVLEGLILCLLHGDSSSQAYSLRRNALRVLTFVATSGQKGAAFLLAKETALNKAEVVKKERDGIQDRKASALLSGSLPVHLITLLDQELKTDEDRPSVMTSMQIEERDNVIREALMLLCRLASHATQSSKTLAAITGDKGIARLSMSVTNRLMSSAAFSERPRSQGKTITSPVDMIELCKGLRRRILASISDL